MSEIVGSRKVGSGAVGILIGVALVSLVAVAGRNIPLPGLAGALLASWVGQGGLPSQLSILALGVTPILSAFALGQVIRLLFPRTDGSISLAVCEAVLAMLIAVGQAYSAARGLDAMGYLGDQGSYDFFSVIAALVGGVAVVLLLSRQVVLPGLLAGLWILWLLPAFLDLPSNILASVDMARTGAASGTQFLEVLLFTIAVAALSAFVVMAVLRHYRHWVAGRTDAKRLFPLAIVVWPPLLAAIVGSYLLVPLALFAPDAVLQNSHMGAYFTGVTAILVPLLVLGYRRLFDRRGLSLPSSLLLLIAATQIAAILGTEFAINKMLLVLPLNGTTILVAVAVCCALIDACLPAPHAERTDNPA